MGGYVGAYGHDGLHSWPFLSLGEELRRAMPRIFASHKLRFLWAYKYDSRHRGITVHADRAAVNVNIWLTQDSANLDPNSGGLVIYPARATEGQQRDGSAIDGIAGVEEYTRRLQGTDNATIPYRCNRMVIFDSALYHRTDDFRFKKGYKNRRINLTYLYGSAL